MEATRTLIVGVTSLFITACPLFHFRLSLLPVQDRQPIGLQPLQLAGALHERTGTRSRRVQSFRFPHEEQGDDEGHDDS